MPHRVTVTRSSAPRAGGGNAPTRALSLRRRLSRRNAVAAGVLLVCLLATRGGQSPADSLSFLGQGAGTYWYLASATDFAWDPGDVVALTGMEQVTGGNAPAGFTIAYSPYSVTWTCTQATFGFPVFGVQSAAPPGTIAYSIESADPSAGFTPGPEYVPEPTTVGMFCTGLVALGAALWRRRATHARHV